MSRRRKLDRTEYRAMICNMVDIGFTVPAIGYMTGRTQPAVYSLLKRLGKMKGSRVLRHSPLAVNADTVKHMQRVFHDPDHVADALHLIRRNGKG